jgi:hypothetical protein
MQEPEYKSSKKLNKKSYKRDFFDEEKKDQSKSIKSFKQRKRELESDDDDWTNWKNEYNT